ncbi:MAG: hypothetical protein FD138_645 [Planctomycetota bacterium]|nr:MAG: hypothetical protein FD138_645 [Planctomycetota bacterium]
MWNVRRSSAGGPKVVAVVFSLIGSVFLMIGAGFGWSSYSLLAVAQRADGTVIRLVHQGGGKRSGSAPVVEFHLDGNRHEFRSWLSTSPPQFDVGDKVTVLYDPTDPQRARIESFVTLWLFPTIFSGIGVVMLVVSGVLFAVSWLRMSPTASVSTDADSGNFLDERTET